MVGRAGIDQRVTARGEGIEAGGSLLIGSSLTEVHADIAHALALGLSASVSWDGTSTDVTGGHSLTVPAFDFPVSASETFTASIQSPEAEFSHNLAVRAEIPGIAGALAASAAASATVSDRTLQQTWSGSVNAFQGSPFSVSVSVEAKQISSEYGPSNTGYLPLLGTAYTLLAPSHHDEFAARDGRADVRALADTQVIDLEISPTLWYRVTGIAADVSETGGSLLLAAPITIPITAHTEITVAPEYSLAFSSTTGGYSGYGIADDVTAYFSGFTTRRYLLSGPGYDVFAKEITPRFSEQTADDVAADYVPALSLTLSRNFGSYIRDLFAPSKVSIELNRALRRGQDAVTDEFAATARLRSTALNLFGELGVYPFFDFYSTDEFSWNLGATANYVSMSFEYYSVLLQHYLYFSLLDGEALIIDNRFELDTEDALSWTESLSAAFSWLTPLESGISLPSVNIELKKDVYFRHSESLRFDLADFALEFDIGHTSELFLGDIGSISALLHIGVAKEDDVWFFGAEAGVRARISF